MDAPPTLEVRRVSRSADLEKPGDYCLIEKREPIRRIVPVEKEEPKGFWRRLFSALLDNSCRAIPKEVIEIVWPDYDAIILLCPHCQQPIATTKEHRILSLEPLTIEKPLACAPCWRCGRWSPKNATEAMLAVQMFGVHNAAIKFLKRAVTEGQTFQWTPDQNGILLLALVQAHDSAYDLAHQVAAEVRRLQAQFQGDLP